MSVEEIKNEIASLREKLLQHPIYKELSSKEDINTFMEQHAFAVWDFMSLVKWLQNKVTCTDVPWSHSRVDGKYQRFINEIVLAEESDKFHDGRYMSHFEMYLEAMAESGADASLINEFIKGAKGKKDVPAYLKQTILPGNIMPFLSYTFELLKEGKKHKIVSAFTFGREDLIPDMFIGVVKGLNEEHKGEFSSLVYYLERHIELDGDEHGPMALQMVEQFCGKNEVKWQEAAEAAKDALKMRLRLWDGIYDSIRMPKSLRTKTLV